MAIPNATCATATNVPSVPFSDSVDTTTAAADPSVSPSCIVGPPDRAAWWSVLNDSTRDRLLIIDTAGTTYYTGISVWRGACASLVEVTCITNAYSGKAVYATCAIAAGETLKILICDNDLGLGGTLDVSVAIKDFTLGLIAGDDGTPYDQSLALFNTGGDSVGWDNSYSSVLSSFDRDPVGKDVFGISAPTVAASGAIAFRRFSPSAGLLESIASTAPSDAGQWGCSSLRFAGNGRLYGGWFGAVPTPGLLSIQRYSPATLEVIGEWTGFTPNPDNRVFYLVGVSPDSTEAYFVMTGGPGVDQNQLYAITLATSTVRVVATYDTFSGGVNPTGWVLSRYATVLSNGDIVILADHQTVGVVDQSVVIRYTTAGVIVAAAVVTINVPGDSSRGICVADEAESAVWILGAQGIAKHSTETLAEQLTVAIPDSAYNGIVSVGAIPEQPFEQQIRMVRRFPLPFDRSFWVYISRIEILLQSGVGLPGDTDQGVDPVMQIRFSSDGGMTWGPLLQLPMGQRGQYQLRQVVNRVGKLRNGYCEVSVSDPVYAYLLDAFINVDESYG